MTLRSLALLAAIGLASAAQAHDFQTGGLTVLHPFAIETATHATTGAGYLSIRNDGETEDALIAVEAEFPRVTLHTSVEADGMMTMQPLDRLEIAPGETVTLAPGEGGHVMFMGLDAPFEAGSRFPARLVFERAGEIAVEFVVETRPVAGAHEGMDHGDMHGGDAGEMMHDTMDHETMDHGDMDHETMGHDDMTHDMATPAAE
ncbi:copper chaperone PCu(A)C [uncultured Limimaricola sp.]|uniref:copper chaperone PCu(A)C n=1 Tax=uncultured Limimaricola sp. TaxID=2211667 RepID=UPI0030FC9925